MSYIGNNPEVNVFTAKVDKFSGNGACTEFTLSRTLDDANAILVIVNSVVQTPISSYSIANGVMTFTEAPSSGTENIVVNYTSPITLTFNQINESQIQANTVSETQLAPNSVSSTKIKPNAITGDKMANNSIRANNIVANQITGDKLANNAIRGNNIVAGTITNNLFATGAITADIISGAFSATQGGTGFTSYTVGDILFANTTTSLSTLPAVDAGNVLRSAGVGAHPTYGKVNLATDITGNLPVLNLADGTNASQFTFWRGDGSWNKISLVNNIVGNLPVSNLNGGSGATDTTFWRGDGTWATPASSGDVTGPANAPDNSIARFEGTTGKIIQATTGATISDSGQAIFTGYTYVNGTSTSAAVLRLHENTTTGTDYVEIKAPSAIAANVVLTLPDNDGTAANQAMITDGSGTLSFGAINLNSTSCVTGNLRVTNLNGGTGANNTTFWRGDGVWATPASGGGGSGNVSGPSSSTTNAIAIFNDTTGTKIWHNALANVNATAFLFSSGASISGSVSAARFSGSGAALTSLNGDNVSSGTVAAARLPTAAAGSSGIVNTSTQSFSGAKTFSTGIDTAGIEVLSGNTLNWGANTAAYLQAGGPTSASLYFDVVSKRMLELTVLADVRDSVTPGGDNDTNLGAPGRKWEVVYAGTGTINTSDANEKQDIADLDAAEKRVAVRIKSLIKKYRFIDAVEKKGDNARIHVGVIAQDVRDAFLAESLDPTRYALFCSDTWWEKEVEEVNPTSKELQTENKIYRTFEEGAVEKTRLGVRYDELLAFVIAAM